MIDDDERERRQPVMHDTSPLGSWAADAACIGKPPEWFAPLDRGELETDADVDDYLYALRHAAATCVDCPVRMDCLAHAQRCGEIGIWGGYRFTMAGARDGTTPVDIVALLVHPDSYWRNKSSQMRKTTRRKQREAAVLAALESSEGVGA